MTIEERLDLLEFQVELLSNGSGIDHFLYETKVTRSQYIALMNMMDKYRNMIDKGESVYHGTFEREVYELVPQKAGDYHFCKSFTQLLAEDQRWEEVFSTLYGDMT